MNEQEAIKEYIHELRRDVCILKWPIDDTKKETVYDRVRRTKKLDVIKAVISALEEILKYRAIGTVEECRAAMEKQKAKKLSYEGDGCDDAGNIIYDTAICPVCGKNFEAEYCEHSAYCPGCGSRIDWSVEE